MLIERLYDDTLAQASYLVGCPATGEALIVDPNRDVAQYLRAASARGLRVSHVTETHIHADFVSGSRELAQRAGARLLLSDEGGPGWRYEFAAEGHAVLLRDGDTFHVGNLRFDVLHTPGHTPEHLALLVTDTRAARVPMGIFSGDFLFVGDVGRPDLLERAAGLEGTMVQAARTLYHSLQRLAALPDYLQVWPGHGAGSACGKALGAVPSSTLGYERLANWALAPEMTEDAFVEQVLAGQPEPPRYFAEMKRLNRAGPPPLGVLGRPPLVSPERVRTLLADGEWVIDTRPADDFAGGHIPGTVSIPLNQSFTTWAGSLLPYDRVLHLLIDTGNAGLVDEAVRDLALIGLDRVAGLLPAEAVAAWPRSAGREPLGTMPEMDAERLADRLRRQGASDGVHIIDVRGAAEWAAGHIPGARNIPLGDLLHRRSELPDSGTLVLHCQTGARSAIGASLLRARGFRNVVHLKGGCAMWQARGLPMLPEPPVISTAGAAAQ